VTARLSGSDPFAVASSLLPRPQSSSPRADIPAFIVPSWETAPEAWDTCEFESTTRKELFSLPGLIDPKSLVPKRSQKIDVKPAPGVDGATITFQGIDLARFDITCLMWTEAHWEQYQRVIGKIEPKAGKAAPDVWRVLHPRAMARNISAAVVESVDGPEQQSTGAYTLTLSMIEYRPIKRVPPRTMTPKVNLSSSGIQLSPGLNQIAQSVQTTNAARRAP
jgi:hypothetical protein